MPAGSRPGVAVIGAGISGLMAAYVLNRTHDVTLFEAQQRFGGHAHTHEVIASDGTPLRIDSGFIVHNERSYPNLIRLFRELDVATQDSEMSMSVSCEGCGLAYAGGKGIGGLLAQPRRALQPRFMHTLSEVPRFHRAARRLLAGQSPFPRRRPAAEPPDPTWGEFLRLGGFSTHFVRHVAMPLVACVWSAGTEDAYDYPAKHLFSFLGHHGMLTVTGSPTWRTVIGGSKTYVDRIVARLPDVRRAAPVTAVLRTTDGIEVRTADGALTTTDQAVIATHADEALELLADADRQEKDDLGAISYSDNETWLHRDASVLPRAPRARASWNYRITACDTDQPQVLVNYWMNRLHGLTGTEDHLVTLNPAGRVRPETRLAAMTYRHPIFTHAAIAAGARLRAAGGPRLAFAGAHLGWGFHEDGCRSGVDAAHRLGGSW